MLLCIRTFVAARHQRLTHRWAKLTLPCVCDVRSTSHLYNISARHVNWTEYSEQLVHFYQALLEESTICLGQLLVIVWLECKPAFPICTHLLV